MPKKIENRILKICPPAPDFLSPRARDHYEWIVPLLIKDKVVCSVDVPIIAAACECYASFLSEKKISDKKAAIAIYEKLMSSFGVTYKARLNLKLSKEEKNAETSEYEGLFDD